MKPVGIEVLLVFFRPRQEIDDVICLREKLVDCGLRMNANGFIAAGRTPGGEDFRAERLQKLDQSPRNGAESHQQRRLAGERRDVESQRLISPLALLLRRQTRGQTPAES